MKRYLFFVFAYLCIQTAAAQAENDNEAQFHNEYGTKDFGGFILDMGTMLNAGSLIVQPPLTLSALPWDAGMSDNGTTALKLNPEALRFNPNLTSIGGTLTGGFQPGFYSALYPGAMNGRVQLQGASYRFNNGARLNTYGEYDADGYKRYNPAALPWERNNFNAAFEFKSPNGKFGIRMEVQHGRYHPY